MCTYTNGGLPVAEEIVVEAHSGIGVGRIGSVKMSTGVSSGGDGGGVRGRGGRREKEGEEHGVAVAASVGRSKDDGAGNIGGEENDLGRVECDDE